MKPATNSNAPAAIRPYASAILDPSKEQSDALRQTQRVFKNQSAIIQRRRSAVRPIWTGRRDTKFGEAVKVRNSSLPLVVRFVTPLNCHQHNR